MQALKLLRAHKTFTFTNAELTIVGQTSAVRFVASKGRRKFRVEPLPEKVKGALFCYLVNFVRLAMS